MVPVVHCLKFVLFTAKFHCTQTCSVNLALGCIFSYDGHHRSGTRCCPVLVGGPENPLIPRINNVSGCHPCVHNMSALLFAVASITHCVFNWKPMTRHIRNAGRTVLTREAGAALVLVLAVVGLFAGHALRVR